MRFVTEMWDRGFTSAALSGGMRFTRGDMRVDFWPSSGKWTEVGTNVYSASPSDMLKLADRYTLTEPAPAPDDNVPLDTSWVKRWSKPGEPPWEV